MRTKALSSRAHKPEERQAARVGLSARAVVETANQVCGSAQGGLRPDPACEWAQQVSAWTVSPTAGFHLHLPSPCYPPKVMKQVPQQEAPFSPVLSPSVVWDQISFSPRGQLANCHPEEEVKKSDETGRAWERRPRRGGGSLLLG